MRTGVTVSSTKNPRGTANKARALLLRLEAIWSRCADSRPIAYTLFAILYSVPSLVLAHRKLIWTDEFFTLYLSKTRNWSELWHALSTGGDQHPPSFYYLTHLIFYVAGTTHLTLRLAPLIGFGLFCICLCEIARRVVGQRWALVALLLPLTTPDLDFATQGRGYGIELGFVTFSLLMWILASEGKKRAWTIPALAVGLGLAVASHYYAILLLIPLVAGEFVKTRLRRSIDIPVYSALLAALIPFVLFAPLILKAKTYSAHFWAAPTWGQIILWYPKSTGYMILLFFVASGLSFMFRSFASPQWRKAASPVSTPVVVALAVTALLPIAGMVIAQFVTHAFYDRYFVAALPGTCIIVVWGLQRIMRNIRAGAPLISILCILLFAQEWRSLSRIQVDTLQQYKSVAALLRHTGNTPIVMSDNLGFYTLSFYGRRDLVNRMVWAADPHRSARYLGYDTLDRSLLDLAPWFPLKIMWWHEWWRTHPSSLLYGWEDDWDWGTYAANEVGRVQVLNRYNGSLLLGVTRTHVPEDNQTASDPPGKPRLYDQLPADGPPLCNTYMPTETCPIVDDPNFPAPFMEKPPNFSLENWGAITSPDLE
jgi:hypothetical protein